MKEKESKLSISFKLVAEIISLGFIIWGISLGGINLLPMAVLLFLFMRGNLSLYLNVKEKNIFYIVLDSLFLVIVSYGILTK